MNKMSTMTAQKENFIKVFLSCMGNIGETCRKCNIKSRQTYYNWMENDIEFRTAIEEAEESLIDFAESQMMQLIKGVPNYVDKEVIDENGNKTIVKEFAGWIEKPDRWMITYFLNNKGQKRGYLNRKEISFTNGNALDKRVSEMSDKQLDGELLELLEETEHEEIDE